MNQHLAQLKIQLKKFSCDPRYFQKREAVFNPIILVSLHPEQLLQLCPENINSNRKSYMEELFIHQRKICLVS